MRRTTLERNRLISFLNYRWWECLITAMALAAFGWSLSHYGYSNFSFWWIGYFSIAFVLMAWFSNTWTWGMEWFVWPITLILAIIVSLKNAYTDEEKRLWQKGFVLDRGNLTLDQAKKRVKFLKRRGFDAEWTIHYGACVTLMRIKKMPLRRTTTLKRKTRLQSRTPLKRKTGLKARKGLVRKPIAPMSLKKLRELNAEVPARIALCQRAGGQPIIRHSTIRIKGEPHTLTTVKCLGGRCEICHRPATGTYLEPHENKMRGRGGKLSLENSVMAHHACHMREGHRQKVNTESRPMWSGK